MPVPSAITDLSQTAGSNYPAGSESPITADDYFRAHASFIALLRDGKGFTDMVTLASGSTTDIGGQNAMAVEITGTTTITSFGTTYNGPRFLRFTGALTLTHNATTLILPGGANITTAAGDTCIAIPTSSANGWVVLAYQKLNGVGIYAVGTSANNLVQLDSSAKLPAVNGSQLTGIASISLKNKLNNSNFTINQRNKSGTVTLAAGEYGHDFWKAGASGCTYTFATSENVTTLTISAGSLIQKVDGKDLLTETHVLSWTGTAQGKIGAGSFSSTGVTGSVTGGTDLNIEFNTGTLSKVQLEPGSVATAYDMRPRTYELLQCQTIYERGGDNTTTTADQSFRACYSGSSDWPVKFATQKRAAPSVTVYSNSTGAADKWRDSSAGVDVTATVPVTTISGFVSRATTTDVNLYSFTWEAVVTW